MVLVNIDSPSTQVVVSGNQVVFRDRKGRCTAVDTTAGKVTCSIAGRSHVAKLNKNYQWKINNRTPDPEDHEYIERAWEKAINLSDQNRRRELQRSSCCVIS